MTDKLSSQFKSKLESHKNPMSSEQTSVSFPYTRCNVFSATKLSRLGTRHIRFQPIRSDVMRELLMCTDTPPKSDKNNTDRKESGTSKTTNSIDSFNELKDSVSSASDVEIDENENDEDGAHSGVSRLENTPPKFTKIAITQLDLTPMSKVFSKLSIDKEDDSQGNNNKKVKNTSQEEKPIRQLSHNFFKTSVATSSNASTSVQSSAVNTTKSTIYPQNKITNSSQKIQYSVRSTIKEGTKNNLPLAVSAKTKQIENTPHRSQNLQVVKKYETPNNNHFNANKNFVTPRQNIPSSSLVKTEYPRQTSENNPKKSDIILREKDMNIKNNVDIENQKSQKRNVQFSMPIPTCNLPDKTFKSLTVRGKEYIIISKLGEGGSCQVYNCLEPETLQHRAIKIVNLLVDAVTANGYINEVKMLGTLQGSDHVIKMFDYEQTKQTLFVIMEKGGIDLSIFLRNIASKSSQLPKYLIIYYWMEMLNCVKEIHDNGIIHSDLKPSNFLIVDGRLKLIDFGIASRLSADMTSVIKNVQVGTFNYISPEAIQDSRSETSPSNDKPRIRISYKSDVWSLGCILYQMVYRKTPFHGFGNGWAKIAAIVDENHKIQYPRIENVPEQLIDTIKKCLTYEMSKRPTVLELINMYNGNDI